MFFILPFPNIPGAVPSSSNRCGHLLRLQLQLLHEGNALRKVGRNLLYQIPDTILIHPTSNYVLFRLIEELKHKESNEDTARKMDVKKGKVGFDMGLKVSQALCLYTWAGRHRQPQQPGKSCNRKLWWQRLPGAHVTMMMDFPFFYRFTLETPASSPSWGTELFRWSILSAFPQQFFLQVQPGHENHVEVSGIKISAHPGIRSYSLEDRWKHLNYTFLYHVWWV